MIRTNDISKSLQATLQEAFSDNSSPDYTANFSINLISSEQFLTAEEYECENCTFEITFNANNSSAEDMLSKKETLETILQKPLCVEITDKTTGITTKVFQEIKSFSSSINENAALVCRADLQINRFISSVNRYDEYENDELMDELETEI